MLTRLSYVNTTEPVTVAEAALAARVDASDELQTLMSGLIATAREQAEQVTGRIYRSSIWRWTGSAFPAAPLPILGVTAAAVTYWNGAQMAALPGSAYVFTPSVDQPGTILAPALGSSWPTLAPISAGARVQADLTVVVLGPSIPETVKTFIKANVAFWLKNPEAVSSASLSLNPLFVRLLDSELTFF